MHGGCQNSLLCRGLLRRQQQRGGDPSQRPSLGDVVVIEGEGRRDLSIVSHIVCLPKERFPPGTSIEVVVEKNCHSAKLLLSASVIVINLYHSCHHTRASVTSTSTGDHHSSIQAQVSLAKASIDYYHLDQEIQRQCNV